MEPSVRYSAYCHSRAGGGGLECNLPRRPRDLRQGLGYLDRSGFADRVLFHVGDRGAELTNGMAISN